jgi:hypothetical protein
MSPTASVRRPVPHRARQLAAEWARRFAQDAEFGTRLNDAHERLRRANDRLWSGLHPDGMVAVYGDAMAVADAAFTENHSEVLASPDPLRAVQEVHWAIRRAVVDYQRAAEERRQLAADIGELTREFADSLVAAGWTENAARNVDVRELADGEVSA